MRRLDTQLLFEILHIIHHVYSHRKGHEHESHDQEDKEKPSARSWVPVMLLLWYVWEVVSWMRRSIILHKLQSEESEQCQMGDGLANHEVAGWTGASLGINVITLVVVGVLKYPEAALDIDFDKVRFQARPSRRNAFFTHHRVNCAADMLTCTGAPEHGGCAVLLSVRHQPRGELRGACLRWQRRVDEPTDLPGLHRVGRHAWAVVSSSLSSW